MAWFTSWLPSFPTINFAIPTAIQGRFISFVLKKTLGHLLKPGQLDYHQIDSQIGSGYVQVNDLELDPKAINVYLEGLPLSLQEGNISSAKARIPWPNPLASTLGFSLTAAHLVFHVVPLQARVSRPDVDLADSVTSAAESFIHEELSQKEETTLWQSFHQEAPPPSTEPDDQIIPGGLGGTSTGATDVTHRPDNDPAGVSVFASLIENLLARFEFDAEDIKITLVHPGNVRLTISLQEIRYRTDSKVGSKDANLDSSGGGESRTLSVSGLSLSIAQLGTAKPVSMLSRNANFSFHDSPRMTTPRPMSRRSSSSSLDEDTQLAMSQSIAGLPPRPDSPTSPTSSLSSSMYQSALSLSTSHPAHLDPAPENPPSPYTTFQPSPMEDEMFLSFGSQPILIKLNTPSPENKGSEDDPFLPPVETEKSTEELHVSVSMNIIACVAKSWQLPALSRLSQAVSPVDLDPPVSTSTPDLSAKPRLPPLKATASIRGFVLLLDSTPSSRQATHEVTAEFFERPLVPPKSDYGYTRVHLDSLSVSAGILSLQQVEKDLQSSISVEANVTDISVFSFIPSLTTAGSRAVLIPFPLLVTDPYLSSQYPNPHIHPESNATYPTLPSFEIMDWMDNRFADVGPKLSHWRSRSSKSEVASLMPALDICGSRATTLTKGRSLHTHVADQLDARISPLHLRLDLERLFQPGGFFSFFEELLPDEVEVSDKSSISSGATVDEYSQVVPRGGLLEEVESPFGDPTTTTADHVRTGREPRRKSVLKESSQHSRLTITVPAARLSLRCPPPPQYPQRSGIVVIDIHDISVATGSTPSKPSARFASDNLSPDRNVEIKDDAVQLKVQFSRALLASAMVGTKYATAFASIGGLTEEQEGHSGEQPPPLQPCIRVMKPNAGSSKTAAMMALSVDIPAIHGDLSKSQFDGLQYFADDISQFLERMSSNANNDKEVTGDSRDTSLIGSRFFAKSRSGSLSNSTTETAESVVKLTITEAFVRVVVPRSDADLNPRPFDLKASDLDILLELNPDGKQQTILTLGVMDIAVLNTANEGATQMFLDLTSPHSLTTAAKSIVKLRFSTGVVPETNCKETRVKLTLTGFTYTFFPDLEWISDLSAFAKNPPGTFESVIPSDRTRIFVKIVDGSIRLYAPTCPGGIIAHLQDLEFSTDVIGDSRDSSFHVNASALSLLVLDDGARQASLADAGRSLRGVSAWMATGYALVVEVPDLDTFVVNHLNSDPQWKVDIHRIGVRLHLCADTLTALASMFSDLGTLAKSSDDSLETSKERPSVRSSTQNAKSDIMASIEDLTFKRMPEIGPAPDMINDDLPTNMYYLDDSFGAAAGLREIRDDDLDEFDNGDVSDQGSEEDPAVISRVGGETIKILDPQGFDVDEDYFLTIPPETANRTSGLGDAKFSVRVFDGNFNMFLYDGYDWAKTRRTIEEEVKEMRKRLAKIRQLVSNGHVEDPLLEDTSALLFNSIHIGLDDDEDALGEPAALIAAIDRELKEDVETMSWQSLPTFGGNKQPRVPAIRVHGKRLTRSRGPSIEFSFQGLRAEFDRFHDDDPLVSRTFVTVRDVEILDHIKTSTWKKFLTQLRSDSRGNVRETDSDMVRVELRGVRPFPGDPAEEARLKAKILPLRLYVDQDAVDFLKKFFSFTDTHAAPSSEPSDSPEAYIQHAEIFPIDLKLDYKPRRVDYRALKQGRTIELMNFFHFDGAEMTLRHITLAGVTGWGRLFEMLNDLWTPDVKATQLAEVISGVAPIRSVVNVGSGVADLILLPIAQYKKDGRIVRGVQKGATSFVKSTAIEAIKMGAKLATGTQVILEQAEGILGGNFEAVTAESVQSSPGDDFVFENEEIDEETADLISKYAQQPADIKEGVQFAYKSLRRNLSSAAQTILAVPMEVYERSGNEGPVRSVIRAVPIAVLKPMIGASEAVSKTLQGIHNTLDPNVRHENEAKYKLR